MSNNDGGGGTRFNNNNNGGGGGGGSSRRDIHYGEPSRGGGDRDRCDGGGQSIDDNRYDGPSGGGVDRYRLNPIDNNNNASLTTTSGSTNDKKYSDKKKITLLVDKENRGSADDNNNNSSSKKRPRNSNGDNYEDGSLDDDDNGNDDGNDDDDDDDDPRNRISLKKRRRNDEIADLELRDKKLSNLCPQETTEIVHHGIGVATNATTTTATITTTTTVPPSSASASNSSNNITVTPTTTKTLKRMLPSSSSSSGDTTINVDYDDDDDDDDDRIDDPICASTSGSITTYTSAPTTTVHQALITKKTVTSLTTTTSSPVTTVTTTSVNVATTMRKKSPSPYSVVVGSPPSVTTNATTTAATPRTSTTFDDGTTTITIDNNSNASKVGKFEDEIKGYDNFDFFIAALDQAGLKNTLKGIGPYTLLAPTDAACFAYKGCLDEDILKYHIILGKHDSNSFSTTDTYETLNGESITYTRKYRKDFLDDAIIGMIGEIGQTSYPCDIECGNGVIHSIDRVLIPGYTFNNNNNSGRNETSNRNCYICNSPFGGESGRCYNVLACGIRYKKRAEVQKIQDDKKAETERRRAEEEQMKQDKAKRKMDVIIINGGDGNNENKMTTTTTMTKKAPPIHSVVVGSPPTVATNATTTAATPRRGKCKVGDCDKTIKQGGLCYAHGAHKQCEFGDCAKTARQGGRCHRHRVLTEEQKVETERRKAEKEKIRDDKKAEKAETERRRKENRENGITSTSTYLFDHQKPTKTPATEVLHDVEYNKRFVRPYICCGFVYSPSKGVSTDNLVVALIKEIMLLLDQKPTDDVSALFPRKTHQDGAYIQLNLKGSGADRILQKFQDIAPIICFLIEKWKNNPDTSKGDKMLIYPPGGCTSIHNDADKTHRINLHFGDGKTLQLVKDKQLETLYDELICKPNCEYQIYGGTGDMFCSPTICYHRGMIKGKSAGFTIVTNPSSDEIALERPAFLSDVFLELNSMVDDLKCSSQSVEDYSGRLEEKFRTFFREKL